MIARRHLLPLVALPLAAVGVAAQEPPPAADLLRAAIEAHGGDSALAAPPATESRGQVELFGRFAGRRAPIVVREREDGAYRREIEFEFRGRKVDVIEFYDRQVRKRRFGSSWDDLPTVEADEAVAHGMGFLLAADPRDARVEGAGTEDDRAVWHMTVPDGDGEARMALDRETGRLVSIEYPGTSAAGMGTTEEVRRKQVFRDYRPVGDRVVAFDVETIEDGSPTSRIRYDTIEMIDAFDPDWVRIPDPTRRFIPGEELAN